MTWIVPSGAGPLATATVVTGAVATAATPEPTPTPGGFSEPWEVSPGIGGFLAFFALALALVVIVRFMSRSVRRIDHAANSRPTAPVPSGGIVDDRAARGERAPRGENAPRGEDAPRDAGVPPEERDAPPTTA